MSTARGSMPSSAPPVGAPRGARPRRAAPSWRPPRSTRGPRATRRSPDHAVHPPAGRRVPGGPEQHLGSVVATRLHGQGAAHDPTLGWRRGDEAPVVRALDQVDREARERGRRMVSRPALSADPPVMASETWIAGRSSSSRSVRSRNRLRAARRRRSRRRRVRGPRRTGSPRRPGRGSSPGALRGPARRQSGAERAVEGRLTARSVRSETPARTRPDRRDPAASHRRSGGRARRRPGRRSPRPGSPPPTPTPRAAAAGVRRGASRTTAARSGRPGCRTC